MSSLRRAGRRTLKSPAAAARRAVSSRARAGSSWPPRPFRAVPLAALAVVPLVALPAVPLAVLPAVPLAGFRAELDFRKSPCRTAAVFAMPAPPMSFQSELPLHGGAPGLPVTALEVTAVWPPARRPLDAFLGGYQPPRQSAFEARRLADSKRACLRLSSRHWISEKMMMIVGNIAFVMFTSLVSPNQPSPE